MKSILLLLLFVTASIAEPGHDVTNKLLKKKIPKRFVPVHDGPNQIQEDKKTEQNLLSVQDVDIKPENNTTSNAVNIEHEKLENVRKKKSAVTTFCVEIRPSNPYQKPFQVCEPEHYSSYAQPNHYEASSKPYAAPTYSKPAATTTYGGSSESSYSPTYSAPKDTYQKPAATSGGYSSTSHSTGTYPASPSSHSYRSKADIVGQSPTDNIMKSENPMKEPQQTPPLIFPLTNMEPVKRSMDDEDDDEDDELQERTAARTLKPYPTYIAYSKPSKHGYKKGGHNGLVITCQPSLAGVAHTIPHEYGYGYGHGSGHGYGQVGYGGSAYGGSAYGGYKRSQENEGMFNADKSEFARSPQYGYSYGYGEGTSKYGGGFKKGESSMHGKYEAPSYGKGYEVYEYKAPSKHESSYGYEAPKYEVPKYEYKAPSKFEGSYGYEAPKYEAPNYAYKAPAKYESSYGYESPKYEAPKYEKGYEKYEEYKAPAKYEHSYEYKAPKYEAPKYEAPKYETPKYEAPKYEKGYEYKAPAKYESSYGHEAPKYEDMYEAAKYEAPKYEASKYEYKAPASSYGYDAHKYDAHKYEAPKYEIKYGSSYGYGSEGYGKAPSGYKPPGTYRAMDGDDTEIMPTARSSEVIQMLSDEDQSKSLKQEVPAQITDTKNIGEKSLTVSEQAGAEVRDAKDSHERQSGEAVVGLSAPTSTAWSDADLGRFADQENLLRATNKDNMDEMNRKRMSGGKW